MSLDDSGKSLWQIKRPPLAMLFAGRATAMLTSRLPAEGRAPFDALSQALSGWPNGEGDPNSICEKEFAHCLEAVGAHETEGMKAAMTGAYVQMAALLMAKPRSLPAGGYYEMDEEDFLKLLRAAAKASRLPVAQLESRMKLLIDHKNERWPKLIALVDKMRWDRGAPWGKLDKRVRALAALADLGATWSWSAVGGQQVLCLELDGTRRISALKPEELAALKVVIPSIGEPGEGDRA